MLKNNKLTPLNAQQSTLNQEQSTLNPQPSTLNKAKEKPQFRMKLRFFLCYIK